MAVPKKRTSKAKSGKEKWKRKAINVSQNALSLAKSLLKAKSTSFVYLGKDLIENYN